jgi:RNA-directed DNA polymerase
MERQIEPHFHKDSYGYRPLRSSHQAIEEVRKNCKEKDWVIDLDISKFFDEIDHELLMKALDKLIKGKWIKMYVKRWLEMKIVNREGKEYDRGGKGTPQGGVISPLLANLFLHYALDKWLGIHYSHIHFVRYADDVIIHCDSKEEAENILKAIKNRMQQVKLRLNEEKTHIVYCKDYRRKEKHNKVQFDFLGFSYKPRRSQSKCKKNKCYTAYTAEINKRNQMRITEAIKKAVSWRDTTVELRVIAKELNSKLRGWINQFGLYGKGALRRIMLRLERRLLKWIQNKHKIRGIKEAIEKLNAVRKEKPMLFYHWAKGYC